MKNLLNFIYRNNFFFVFLVLEFICVFILIRNNGYQGSSLLNSSNAISANIYAMLADVVRRLARDTDTSPNGGPSEEDEWTHMSERRPVRIGMNSLASAASNTRSGTPADSRPNSRISPLW